MIKDTHKTLIDAEASNKTIENNNNTKLTEEQSRIMFGEVAIEYGDPTGDYSTEYRQQRREAYLNRIKDPEGQVEDHFKTTGERTDLNKFIEDCKNLYRQDKKEKLLKKFMDLNPRERFLCAKYQHTEHNNPKGGAYGCCEECEYYDGDNNRTIKDSEAEDYFKNNEWRDGLSYCNALLGRIELYYAHHKSPYKMIIGYNGIKQINTETGEILYFDIEGNPK